MEDSYSDRQNFYPDTSYEPYSTYEPYLPYDDYKSCSQHESYHSFRSWYSTISPCPSFESLSNIERKLLDPKYLWDPEASEDTSPHICYVKYYFGIPLTKGLCELVSRKPTDPIEYLGHWLLHYQLQEEKNRDRPDYVPFKINIEQMQIKEKTVLEGSEEKFVNDMNFESEEHLSNEE